MTAEIPVSQLKHLPQVSEVRFASLKSRAFCINTPFLFTASLARLACHKNSVNA